MKLYKTKYLTPQLCPQMPSHYRGFKRTTFATPSTYDFRILKSMLEEVTIQTETPAVPAHHLPPTTEPPTTEAGGREGNQYSFLENEKDRLLLANGPETKTNMPMEYLKPVSTKRSHKGHHHDHEHAKSKESLKAMKLDKKPQNKAPQEAKEAEAKEVKPLAGEKHGNKKSKKRHHKNKA